jgi:hypothetical protein
VLLAQRIALELIEADALGIAHCCRAFASGSI